MKVQFTNTFDGAECFSVASNLPPIVGSAESAAAASADQDRAFFGAGFSDGCLRIW